MLANAYYHQDISKPLSIHQQTEYLQKLNYDKSNSNNQSRLTKTDKASENQKLIQLQNDPQREQIILKNCKTSSLSLF